MDRNIANYIIKEVINAYPELSDLLFMPYEPMQILLLGKIKRLDDINGINRFSPFQTETLALALIGNDPRLLKDLISTGSCDFSYQVDHIRLRVNIFSQMRGYTIAMRKLPEKTPTIKDWGLPETFYEIAKETSGIMLFGGPTASGKSTSIATILEEINQNKPLHIISLEDPIEFVFTPAKSTFNQRELGADFYKYVTAFRAALREAPNVVVVGEIRDSEVVKTALDAAETGHLVISTIHSGYPYHAIHRVIDMVGKEEAHFVRYRLQGALRWIVCQRLLPTMAGGRVAIFEILRNTLRIQDAISSESSMENYYDIIETSGVHGMRTFDQDLIRVFGQRLIDEQTAFAYATFRSRVRKGIDQIKLKRGEEIPTLKELIIEGEKKEEKETKFI
jgi:twitching motility protein PilT